MTKPTYEELAAQLEVAREALREYSKELNPVGVCIMVSTCYADKAIATISNPSQAINKIKAEAGAKALREAAAQCYSNKDRCTVLSMADELGRNEGEPE